MALYVDGVYYASQALSFLNLNNVAQIEVLKGPQGTLFGRNATAGLMQAATRTPGRNLEADASLSYGNYDRIEAKAYLSAPIAEDLAADIALSYIHQGDGWGRSIQADAARFYGEQDIPQIAITLPPSRCLRVSPVLANG